MYAWKRMNEQKQNGKLGIDVKMNASESLMMLLLRLLLLRQLQIKLGLRWTLPRSLEGQTVAKLTACSLRNRDVQGRVWLWKIMIAKKKFSLAGTFLIVHTVCSKKKKGKKKNRAKERTKDGLTRNTLGRIICESALAK